VETDLFMQTMETSIWVTRSWSRESSWEVEGVICKIHGRWETWFAKVILQITPPTSSGRPVGSTSCDLDWSFHSLHEEVVFHLIWTGLPNLKSENLTLATWSLIWSHRVSEGKGLPATATGLILTDHRSWQLIPFPAPSVHKNRILLIFFWHGAPTGVQCHHVYSSRTYGHACVTR
jgi:hypothetical protein